MISGSDPEIENPHYGFIVLPMELLLLLSRLEAQQESLTLPNEIFPMLASSLDKQLQQIIWEKMKAAFHF